MPTTGYLAGSDTNDIELAYAPEATWGTSPTGVNYQKFRVNSESFSEQKNRSAPPELRSDGMTADKTTQDLQARGSVPFGISYGNTDDLYAALLAGAWSADLNIVGSSGDIEFETTGNLIKSSTAGKFSNVTEGQWIDVRGATTNPARMFLRVVAKNSNVELAVSGVTLQDETPSGAAVSIHGSMLRNANVVNTFSIQKRFASNLGFIYPGALAIGGQINAARGEFFSGTLDFLVKSEEKAAVAVGTGFDPAPNNRVMNNVGNFKGIRVDDTATTAKIMRLMTNLQREGANMAFALGSEAAQGIGSRGQLSVGGETEIYFATYDDYDRYKAETAHHFSYRVMDTAGNAYVVTIPQLVFETANIVAQGPNQSVMARFGWTGNIDTDTGSKIQIDRFAAPA